MNVWVLWIGPGHRVATCVEVPAAWLVQYRRRVTGEWRGRMLGVYRRKDGLQDYSSFGTRALR